MRTTNFDKRIPFAWWRFIDPYAGFARFLDAGQRITQGLRLDSLAWDFHDAQVRLRENFEKLVQDKALLETKSALTSSLGFYEEQGYLINPGVDRSGIEKAIFKAFVVALKGDEGLTAQFHKLQLLPVGRKALYYRIWLLWEAHDRHLYQIAFDCLKKSFAASDEIDLSAGFVGEEN